ncbi:MAG TPA: hypothetical protein PLN33_15765, partial [Hyphomonadaceae bacterium]|nr:hypothetical protein [Hyphomonadaceae bacterium]
WNSSCDDKAVSSTALRARMAPGPSNRKSPQVSDYPADDLSMLSAEQQRGFEQRASPFSRGYTREEKSSA